MLLGKFKESKANKLIVDIFSLPKDLPDLLFGDLCTSELPIILFNTCGGSIDLIKSMALNKDIDDYCRISACQALTYAVVTDYVSREEVVSLFGTLFTGKETDSSSDFWGLLANFVCSLYPEENIEIIQQAYDDGLIMSGLIHYREFEIALDIGKDQCLENLENDLEQHNIDDLHESMSWWDCFDEMD